MKRVTGYDVNVLGEVSLKCFTLRGFNRGLPGNYCPDFSCCNLKQLFFEGSESIYNGDGHGPYSATTRWMNSASTEYMMKSDVRET